jgi:hypothetical protein
VIGGVIIPGPSEFDDTRGPYPIDGMTNFALVVVDALLVDHALTNAAILFLTEFLNAK